MHDISFNADGKAEAIYGSNKPAWHGFGTVIQGLATGQEVIDTAFQYTKTLVKQPVFITNHLHADNPEQPKGFKVPDQYMVVRQDKSGPESMLGIVGKKHEIIPIERQTEIAEALVESGQGVFEAAGALGKGERTWILAKLPETITVNGKDPVEEYLLLSDSFDGSRSFTAKLTNVRVVCQNTLSLALGQKGETVKIRHTASATDRMSEVARILGVARKQAEKHAEIYQHLAGIQFDTTMLNYFLTMVIPATGLKRTKAQNIRESIELLATKTAKGIDLAGHTMWGAVNAVAEYADHHKNYQAGTNRLDAIWNGSGASLTKRAFNTALEIDKLSESDMLSVIKAESEKFETVEN